MTPDERAEMKCKTLKIENFRCPCCDGPLKAMRSTVGKIEGIVLVCANTVSWQEPENCPDATGVCNDIQEALGHLVPEEVEEYPNCIPIGESRVVELEEKEAKFDKLREVLAECKEWEAMMGGWDAPCWKKAEDILEATKET